MTTFSYKDNQKQRAIGRLFKFTCGHIKWTFTILKQKAMQKHVIKKIRKFKANKEEEK
jgi:hypothetical protein